jgi:hypothetical protein
MARICISLHRSADQCKTLKMVFKLYSSHHENDGWSNNQTVEQPSNPFSLIAGFKRTF